MEKLSDIKVQVINESFETGNLQSVLSEIEFALEQLLETNKAHCIDLRAMPWSPGEQEKLEAFLGKGEIKVELNALGKSIFYETKFSGVWVVNHYSENGEKIGELIEVTFLPDMIFSQKEDIKESLERFKQS